VRAEFIGRDEADQPEGAAFAAVGSKESRGRRPIDAEAPQQGLVGLVFDPRYQDFPFAPLSAAVLPIFMHSETMPRPLGRHGAAEWAAAGILVLAVPYIVLNESIANWQSLSLCAALVLRRRPA